MVVGVGTRVVVAATLAAADVVVIFDCVAVAIDAVDAVPVLFCVMVAIIAVFVVMLGRDHVTEVAVTALIVAASTVAVAGVPIVNVMAMEAATIVDVYVDVASFIVCEVILVVPVANGVEVISGVTDFVIVTTVLDVVEANDLIMIGVELFIVPDAVEDATILTLPIVVAAEVVAVMFIIDCVITCNKVLVGGMTAENVVDATLDETIVPVAFVATNVVNVISVVVTLIVLVALFV